MKTKQIVKFTALFALLLCAACADDEMAANPADIHASSLIYDPQAQPVTVYNGAFVYDINAPALRASQFIVANP